MYTLGEKGFSILCHHPLVCDTRTFHQHGLEELVEEMAVTIILIMEQLVEPVEMAMQLMVGSVVETQDTHFHWHPLR